jgi:hypothetical protein
MEMKLYTNGCSFVWGDELEDRKNEAFPYLLKNRLNCELLNDSQKGSSNQRILRTTLKQNLNDYFVIIGWSSIYRYEYYSDGLWTEVLPRDGAKFRGDEKFKIMKYIKDEWFIVNFLNQVLALQNHLKYHNIPFFFFLSFAGAPIDGEKKYGYDERNSAFPDKPIVDWVDYYSEFFDLVDRKTFPSLFNNELGFRDYCLKNGQKMTLGFNGHPTKESHKLWADYLYENSNFTK